MELTVALVAFAVAVLVLLHLGPWLSARRLQGRPAPELGDIHGGSYARSGRTLYYFYSPHCGPCVDMTPRVERLAERHPNVVKVDVNEERELSRRFGVTVTPSVLIVDDGVIVRVVIGARSEAKLLELLG